MPDADDTPIVLGLYRHDVPEERTLRYVLNWLREHDCRVFDPVVGKSSAEEAKSLLAGYELELNVEAYMKDPTVGVAWPSGDVLGPRLDKTAIDRVVSANEHFPRRLCLLPPPLMEAVVHPGRSILKHPVCFYMMVGYADALPDDGRVDGRRLVQISTSPSRWLFPRLPKDWEIVRRLFPGVERIPTRLTQFLEVLVQEYWLRGGLHYATIRVGRPLLGNADLLRSEDPLDFHRFFIRASMNSTRLLHDFADDAEWQLEWSMRGVYVRLRNPDRELSDRGRELIPRLREVLAEHLT